MKNNWSTEREGQLAFFENYGIHYEDEPVLIDNTDGVYNGILFEFKRSISNIGATLFQAVKYLSRMRIHGESVPATILLVSLNDTHIYEYKSIDYFADIHKVYIGAASKNNSGFIAGKPIKEYDYSNMTDSAKIRHLIKDSKTVSELYMPIDIDENCIVGWAERYYRENPKATKGDFIGDDTGSQVKITGEIREPKHFKGLINPYRGKTNEKFAYLMDCLNDHLQKKDLGAFYTPMAYARKAAELVKIAADRVPDGNDYIILDRCAGTANLEAALIGLKDKNGDELIHHCVISTYEYYEYKVAWERVGDLVREIIPPTEADVVYANGTVANADAMSQEYIENPIIKQYVDDPKCTIILYENVPYSEASTVQMNCKNKSFRSSWKNSYVVQELKKHIKGAPSNEMANAFIWSGFHYYLRQNTDSYVLFSPIKYWKYQHIIDNKAAKNAFVFNRAHFHASPSAITCILWLNEESNIDAIEAQAYDIGENGALIDEGNVKIQKAYHLLSKIYDKRHFDDDEPGIVAEKNGTEALSKSVRGVPIFNKNCIGYIISKAFGFETPRLKTTLTRVQVYDANGFFLRSDNYLKKLPIFVAGKYPIEKDWKENGILCTTSDRGTSYETDYEFLKACLIFTCLSYYNKCLSFDGSDGRHYKNELCFDSNTLASNDLSKMSLDSDEKELLALWKDVLTYAKETHAYNPDKTYGVYQITKELNTKHPDDLTKKRPKMVPDYPKLNTALETLKTNLKTYYKTHITEKMFQYELIK